MGEWEATHKRFDSEFERLQGKLDYIQRALEIVQEVPRVFDELGDVKQQMGSFSSHLEDRRVAELKRFDEVGQMLDNVVDRCCNAQHALAVANNQHAIKDILHAGKANATHVGALTSGSLNIVGQCIADIGVGFRALRHQPIACMPIEIVKFR